MNISSLRHRLISKVVFLSLSGCKTVEAFNRISVSSFLLQSLIVLSDYVMYLILLPEILHWRSARARGHVLGLILWFYTYLCSPIPLTSLCWFISFRNLIFENFVPLILGETNAISNCSWPGRYFLFPLVPIFEMHCFRRYLERTWFKK